MNGRTVGVVEGFCARGLFLSTTLRNLRREPLVLRNLAVDFDPLEGGCGKHRAPIDQTLNGTVAPGAIEQLRVFDAAGTLCQPPYGRPGCRWRATATVSTTEGDGVGALELTGTAPRTTIGDCSRVVPSILGPTAGDTVSGVVRVDATLAEGGGCNITARTVVYAYAESGVIVGQSGLLDIGEPWRWDTTRLSSGLYRLRAEQNCCRILGEAVEVRVRN